MLDVLFEFAPLHLAHSHARLLSTLHPVERPCLEAWLEIRVLVQPNGALQPPSAPALVHLMKVAGGLLLALSHVVLPTNWRARHSR